MPAMLLLYALLFAAALFAAFNVAYDFKWVEFKRWCPELYLPLVLLAVPIKLLVFHYTGQYRGSWRYVGLRDLFSIVSSSLIASFVLLSVYFTVENLWNVLFHHRLIERVANAYFRQSSVFPLDWAATVAFVSVARVLVRFYHEDTRAQQTGETRRVLIVGAGDTGEALLREILRMPFGRYRCVGFLDDEVRQLHGRIHGVEVVGRTADMRALCHQHDIHEVLIALPHATPKTIRRLVERCEGAGVRLRTVPAVTDVIAGRVQVSQIREVDIEDLLGREPVRLDTDKIGAQLRAKRIAVTGAGGSIGAEMCRQIAQFSPERLILLEQAENNLFEIDRELRAAAPEVQVIPYVADITDRARVQAVFDRQRPATVFHAAAHKHVPMMEINPSEAIKNNIRGTTTVADAAVAAGVVKMVMISTDKAVNPTSIMGCSKRVAEMYVQGLDRRVETQFVTVRFGNVLGSSGSVVPIFKQQIADGGPVTVTHADMVRYFMTVSEAAQLVLQAGTMGHGGEIYVLHMGDPVRIVDLARDMITLSGLRPGTDVEITFTGTRPGEKLFEELSHEGEDIGDTAHPKIGIWKHRNDDLDAVITGIDRLLAIADSASNGEIREALADIVPEYRPATDTTTHPPQHAATPRP
ncbi:MAG: polysaccharide biosynthesis protein [Phycisphaerae bacterium]